jgi:hypothetical protein
MIELLYSRCEALGSIAALQKNENKTPKVYNLCCHEAHCLWEFGRETAVVNSNLVV